MSQRIFPEGARLRWLVAGAFSPSPSGRRFFLTGDTFTAELARAASGLRVTVPDRLGAEDVRRFEMSFPKLRCFQVTELLSAVPTLQELQALAEGGLKAERSLTPEEGAARVAEIVGAGRLSSAVSAALQGSPEPAPDAPAAPPAPATGEGALIEELLAQAEASSPMVSAKAGLDAFVRATTSKATGPARTTPDARRAMRDVIELAVLHTARDLLSAEPVARLESAWRGLKFLLDQCPATSGIALEVLDVEPSQVPRALEEAVSDEPFDRPDACFVVDATEDVARLQHLAAVGEAAQVPVVVEVTPALLDTSLAELPSSLEHLKAREDWAALRQEEASRWLCPVLNRMVAVNEQRGLLHRVCMASPVFAIAAMLSASFRATSGFARITGQPGSLRAPGFWVPPTGRENGATYPTEAFLSIRAQTRLAELGLLGLGSGRNTDMMLLAVAPMACANAHVMPLPGQLLTGRIVRFALWVRDQLPAGSGANDLSALFEQAAEVFLFGGKAEVGRLRAELVPGEGGGTVIQVEAAVTPEHAGTPFHLAFALPLRR